VLASSPLSPPAVSALPVHDGSESYLPQERVSQQPAEGRAAVVQGFRSSDVSSDAISSSPNPNGVSHTSSSTTIQRMSSFMENGCNYWQLLKKTCRNGQCSEETEKFRQCEGQPREKAALDEKTGKQVWLPAEEDDQFDIPVRSGTSAVVEAVKLLAATQSMNELCVLQDSVFTGLPFRTLGPIGAATDDLFSQLAPEFDQLRREFERDALHHPWRTMGDLLDALHGPSPMGIYIPPVPGRGPQATLRGGRDIPIEDGRRSTRSNIPTDNGLRDPAEPHPRDLESPQERNGGPSPLQHSLSNIGRSLSGWTHRVKETLEGKGGQHHQQPTVGRRDDTDDEQSDQSDRED
jgi:hypothetical protein